MLFANHLAVSFRALSYGVQGSHCSTGTDRSAAQHTAAPSSAGQVVDYGQPHLCTWAYRALTVAQAQPIVLLPSTLLPSAGMGGVVDYGLPHVCT